MTKPQVINSLLKRFPDADRAQLHAFVESGWRGNIDADGFELMCEAWGEGLGADEARGHGAAE